MKDGMIFSQQSQQVRENADVLGQLFDRLPQVFLFVKDLSGKFVRVNQALAELHGCPSEDGMLGKTDHDFHSEFLADSYQAEDQLVMDSQVPLLNQIWLVPTEVAVRWYRCNKIPAMNAQGEVVGVGGVLLPYEDGGEVPREYSRLQPALAMANERFRESVSVGDLASAAGYSVNQFSRNFQFLFRMTPAQYIRRLRVYEAARLLRNTSKPVGEIALEVGFYDASAFTKVFRKDMGESPLQFRKDWS